MAWLQPYRKLAAESSLKFRAFSSQVQVGWGCQRAKLSCLLASDFAHRAAQQSSLGKETSRFGGSYRMGRNWSGAPQPLTYHRRGQRRDRWPVLIFSLILSLLKGCLRSSGDKSNDMPITSSCPAWLSSRTFCNSRNPI